jgi:nitrilase
MTVLRPVRVAAVQATPVILDARATIEKAVRLLEAAADDGVELAVLPETFVPLYPSQRWAKVAAAFGGVDELWERLWTNAVDVPGPLVDELVAVCARRGLHCVIGVNEREAGRSGSLWNTMLTLGPGGLLHRHRKLMPTQHERLFHGIGRGDDLRVVDTPAGRVGGLICWENRMPLARWALYEAGVQVYVAPTADDSDGWIASMRHIAIESGAFVVSAPQFIPGSAFGEDFPVAVDRDAVYGRGGACIVDPEWGEVVAGPLYDREGVVTWDCDLRRGLYAKRWFDAVGHYSRDDVLPLPPAAQHAGVAAPEGHAVGVQALEQQLHDAPRGPQVVAHAREGDRPLGLDQGDDAITHVGQRVRVDVHGRPEPHR